MTIVNLLELDSDLISALDKSLEIPRHGESCVHDPAYRSRVQFNLRIPRRFAESEASFRGKRDSAGSNDYPATRQNQSSWLWKIAASDSILTRYIFIITYNVYILCETVCVFTIVPLPREWSGRSARIEYRDVCLCDRHTDTHTRKGAPIGVTVRCICATRALIPGVREARLIGVRAVIGRPLSVWSTIGCAVRALWEIEAGDSTMEIAFCTLYSPGKVVKRA